MLRETNDIFIIVYKEKPTEIHVIDSSTREGYCKFMDLMSFVKNNIKKEKIVEYRTFRGYENEIRLEHEWSDWRSHFTNYNDIPIFHK